MRPRIFYTGPQNHFLPEYLPGPLPDFDENKFPDDLPFDADLEGLDCSFAHFAADDPFSAAELFPDPLLNQPI